MAKAKVELTKKQELAAKAAKDIKDNEVVLMIRMKGFSQENGKPLYKLRKVNLNRLTYLSFYKNEAVSYIIEEYVSIPKDCLKYEEWLEKEKAAKKK